MRTTHLFALGSLMVASLVTSASAGDRGEGPWARGECHTGERAGYAYGGHDYVGDFAKKNGVKFSDGYFYVGKVQKHFTKRWYVPPFKTYFYWDPHAHCPYYWCEGHGVWYPVRNIEKVAPTAKGPGPVVEKSGAAPPPDGDNSGGNNPEGGPVSDGAPPDLDGNPAGPAPAVKGQGPSAGPQPTPKGAGVPVKPVSATGNLALAKNQAQSSVARVEVQSVPTGTFEEPIAQ